MINNDPATIKAPSTSGIGAVEYSIEVSKKNKKKARKIKDGTDGIDACDERDLYDRLSDGFPSAEEN